MTCDTDMWHVTLDVWHVTHLGRWTSSPNFSFLALTVWELRYFEYISTNHHWMTELMNHGGVCRTAPATPGLLIKAGCLLNFRTKIFPKKFRSYVLQKESKKVKHLESWFRIKILRAKTFTKCSFHVCPPKIVKYGSLMSETQKIMKTVTTWGRKTDQEYLLNSWGNSQKKIVKEKYKRKLFDVKISPRFHLYEALKNLYNFAMTISQWKIELEKLELLPPDAAGPQDIPRRRVAQPGMAGPLFRYIICLENLQSFLNSTVS